MHLSKDLVGGDGCRGLVKLTGKLPIVLQMSELASEARSNLLRVGDLDVSFVDLRTVEPSESNTGLTDSNRGFVHRFVSHLLPSRRRLQLSRLQLL